MTSTTLLGIQPTVSLDNNQKIIKPPAELVTRYHDLLACRKLSWTVHPKLIRQLGQGGQGVVFLSAQRGADGFTLPIALKLFSPERYENTQSYELSMQRIARVASHVAQIQHDNLLSVQDFYDRNFIRVMAMEWVDGYDLRRLLKNDSIEQIRHRVSLNRWEHINRVIVTSGPVQPRLKPGVAVAVVRECLGALASLHRDGIVHGDIKPGNIMLKRTGHAKIIDIGSAFELDDPPVMKTCTPSYAAPEVLGGGEPTPRSDLASLGYVLIELLAGRPIFEKTASYKALLEAKRWIHQKVTDLLPQEVTCNSLLMNFCRKLIAPDPTARFPNAEVADLVKGGAAAFHRQLIKGDLASEYDNDIRLWLNEIRELEEIETEADTQPR